MNRKLIAKFVFDELAVLNHYVVDAVELVVGWECFHRHAEAIVGALIFAEQFGVSSGIILLIRDVSRGCADHGPALNDLTRNAIAHAVAVWDEFRSHA